MPLGDGFVLRNAYISNVRDDCVENDVLSGGLIEDSLFDGCYMGLSVDPARSCARRRSRMTCRSCSTGC